MHASCPHAHALHASCPCLPFPPFSFENVTAVLFVAAISEYDQVLYEDENTNRIVEALNLFEEICNSRWFRETSMILFLNKRDLFQEKCKKVSLSVSFPDYQGDDSYEAGVEFLQEQFETKNRNPDKQIYTHVTCATDTDNISGEWAAAHARVSSWCRCWP